MRRFIKVLFIIALVCFIGLFGFTIGVAYCTFYTPKVSIPERNSDIATDEYKEPEAVQPVANQEVITTYNTKYRILSYDITTGEENEELAAIPAQYIGKTREEVELILKESSKSPTLSEREKGFVSSKLERFSEEEIVVWKLYSSEDKKDSFYLMAEEDMIVVYREDKETIYMHTGININDLPLNSQQDIRNGKFISSVEELYYFLESYTS